MRVEVARHSWRSTHRAFVSIQDSCLHFPRRVKKAVFESLSAAPRRRKKRKRTRKTFKRSRNETRTQFSIPKTKRGECLLVENSRAKKLKSCRLVSKLPVLTQQSRDRKQSRKSNQRVTTVVRCD